MVEAVVAIVVMGVVVTAVVVIQSYISRCFMMPNMAYSRSTEMTSTQKEVIYWRQMFNNQPV